MPLFVVLPRSQSWLTAGALAGVAAFGVTTLAFEAAAALGSRWHLFAVVVGAVPFAVAGGAAWAVGRRLPTGAAHLAVALFWAVAEFLPAQPELLGRFALPLSTFGYSQAGLPAMHLARFSSVTATSAAILLANVATAYLVMRVWLDPAGNRLRAALPPLTGLLLLAGVVVGAQLTAPAPTGTTMDVAIVQPDRPTAVLASATRVEAVRDHVLEELTSLVASHSTSAYVSPDLIVFPEGSWPHPISTERPVASLPTASVATLEGLPTALLGAAGRTDQDQSTNSAFLWSGGALVHAYTKLHLVPIGEAGLTAGSELVPVQVPTVDGNSLPVAPLICYDVAFSKTVRRAVQDGAQLLAVLTDDAFAARGDVPHQHLRLARFRAVESGVPLAFASNTGPSALIASDGSLAAVSTVGQATVLRAELGAGAGSTPYMRYGNWVGALMCLGTITLIGLAALSAAGKRGGVPSEFTSAT